VLSPALLFSAEPSAFGAGDLSSSNPYGLTSNEKVMLATEKKLKNVTLKSDSQSSQLDSLRERLDGLQSIVESLSRKSHNSKINFHNFTISFDKDMQGMNEYQKRLSLSIQENKTDIDKLKLMIVELSKSVDEINAQYVTKLEFNNLINNFNSFKILVGHALKKSGSIKKNRLSSIKSANLYVRAKANYKKKYYNNALNDYKELIRRKYKPAFSHYMIGEINFNRKSYGKAISYFKKSSSLYSKASYMPTLMLHTAISTQKTGDKEHAKAFYNAIINSYPNSKEAIKAEKYLGL
jgi:TolA-binding protein